MKATMKVKGIGNDLIEIDRIKRAIEHHGTYFLDKIFTKKEQHYCLKYNDPYPRFAGRFAAKEAISKALGSGICAKLNWLDLEILNEPAGNIVCHFSPRVIERFEKLNVLLSISHAKNYASAVALITE